jgi:hypothetical protein
LTAWSGDGTRPKASTVNYEPKVIAPNMAVVTAGHGAGGAGLRIANTTSGSVHVVVDLVGIQFANSPYGLRFTPRATPTRILDTRVPTGLAGPFGPAQTRTVNASKVTGLDTWAIVANTTGIKPTKQTYLTTWSGEPGSQRPDASLLNVNPGVVRLRVHGPQPVHALQQRRLDARGPRRRGHPRLLPQQRRDGPVGRGHARDVVGCRWPHHRARLHRPRSAHDRHRQGSQRHPHAAVTGGC